MSEIYLIDYYANSFKSYFHQTNVLAKLIFFALVLFSIVFTSSVPALVFIFAAVLLLLFFSRLPILKILEWSLYPLLFALVFVFSQIQESGELAGQTFFRAITAIFLMFFLALTTPFPLIFSLLGKVSPVISSLMFFAYRYFFLFLNTIEKRVKIMGLRGNNRTGVIKKIKNFSGLLGQTLIELLEKSEKFYKILQARGFQGKVFSDINLDFKNRDWLLIGLGIAIMTTSRGFN